MKTIKEIIELVKIIRSSEVCLLGTKRAMDLLINKGL